MKSKITVISVEQQHLRFFRSVGEKNKNEKGEEGREKRGDRRGEGEEEPLPPPLPLPSSPFSCLFF